eukprot:1574458-Rhodomonas_salina.1
MIPRPRWRPCPTSRPPVAVPSSASHFVPSACERSWKTQRPPSPVGWHGRKISANTAAPGQKHKRQGVATAS